MPPYPFDIIVVGASFAGVACAKAIAQQGLSVAVIERRKDIQKGITTTGILVDEAAALLDIPQHLVKKIQQVRLYSPSMKYVEIRSPSYMFLATDTPALMQYLLDDAKACGVTFFLDTPFEKAVDQGSTLSVNGGFATCRLLIGADGARSTVAQYFNLGLNKKFLIGVEAEYVNIEMDNPDAFYCFLNQDYAAGYIGWAIPGPKVTQIGLATFREEKPDVSAFYRYISPTLKTENAKIVGNRGGLIPIGGLVRPFYNDKVILVGDAAGTVSPLTAGGIHTALYYGKRLGELASRYLCGDGAHPGKVLEKEYPRFYSKHFLRWIFNIVPNVAFELLIQTPGFQYIANQIFFLKKRLPKAKG